MTCHILQKSGSKLKTGGETFSKQKSALPNIILKSCATVFNTLYFLMEYTNTLSLISGIVYAQLYAAEDISQQIDIIIIGMSGAGVRCPCYLLQQGDVSTSVQRMVSVRRQCGPDQPQPLPHHIQPSWVASPNISTATASSSNNNN